MQKVVITDYTFPNLSIEQNILNPTGCELSGHQCKTPESLIKIVRDADYVITQFAPINAQVVNSMEQAKLKKKQLITTSQLLTGKKYL